MVKLSPLIITNALLSVSAAHAEIILVPSERNTIQEAIDHALDGDTIIVAAGVYRGSGNRDINFRGKRIHLLGAEGRSQTVIDAGGTYDEVHQGFRIMEGEDKETLIEGFTITGGYVVGITDEAGGGGGGGAIHIRRANPTIRNCAIVGNIADTLGIGLIADGRGGGILVEESNGTAIENCIITGNVAGKRGGGIYFSHGALDVRNCVIAENECGFTWGGRGVSSNLGTSSYENCTIVYNRGFPGLLNNHGKCSITSCIIWGHDPIELFVQGSSITVDYSLIQGGKEEIDGCCLDQLIWGPGNTSAFPFFVNEQLGDFRLEPPSGGINAGDPLFISSKVSVDLEGHPRVEQCRIDMGAYESTEIGPYESGQLIDCNLNGTSDACDLEENDGSKDCNQNHKPDECDIAEGRSIDVWPPEGDGIPDDCQSDCNGNSIPDLDDIATNNSRDVDQDRIPDECECTVRASVPTSGTIDARQPSELDGAGRTGWSTIELVMCEDAAEIIFEDQFVITSSNGLSPPVIKQLDVRGATVVLTFEDHIPVGAMTTIWHVPSGSHACLGYLPGDSSGNRKTSVLDLHILIDRLNGELPATTRLCDIDRSGNCGPEDILRLIDLLNGAGEYMAWNEVDIAPCP